MNLIGGGGELAPVSSADLESIENPFSFLVSRYARRPRDFVREVLKAIPHEWQAQALDAIASGHRRVSIRSGHGVGKTAFLSWIMLWHLLTRFPQKCVCTAPSAPQLYDALWAELRTWIARLPLGWQQLLEATSDRVELVMAAEQSFISARTSRAEAPEAMAGVHSTWVLLIVDEASGVPEAVFESATGSMSTPGAITILTGNPTRSTGFFYRTHSFEADRWWTLRVASDECAHVDRKFIDDVAARYGKSSNAWRVRILGEFPIADSDTLIGAELVEQAMDRIVAPDFNVPEIWGLDVARFGTDLSVLSKRRGNLVVDRPRSWGGLDLMALSGQVVNEWNKTAPASRPACIVVDDIGMGGGVTDRLREVLPECAIAPMNVGESPSIEGRFRRMRDELWGAAADWLATRQVSLPAHERLRDDLCAPKYRFLSDGKLVVESKAEMRQRRLPSPDFADSLCLTFAPKATTALAVKAMRWGRPIRRRIKGLV
jgi:hypothetical protein